MVTSSEEDISTTDDVSVEHTQIKKQFDATKFEEKDTEMVGDDKLHCGERSSASSKRPSSSSAVVSIESDYENSPSLSSSTISETKSNNTTMMPSAGPFNENRPSNVTFNDQNQSLRERDSQHKYEIVISQHSDTVKYFSKPKD